jgi:hypothetical protein
MKNKTITNKGSSWMGRLFVLLAVALGLQTNHANAQASAYTFSQASGTFTAISGGTLLGSGTIDDNQFNAIPLGLTFNYNGTNYTTINISNNGSAAFTNTAGGYGPLTVNGNNICPLGRDLQGQAGATLRIQTIGTECIIQWLNYRRWNGPVGQNFNFQIRLNSTGNTISFVYGTMTATASNADYDIGINGTLATDFNCRTTTTNWTTTTAGVANTANVTLSPTVFPPSGHTYIYTPPACSSPGGLAASVTGGGTGANISWNAAVPAPANGYQFAVQTSATPPGSGTAFGGLSTSVGSLTPNTTYYLFVRSDCGLGVFSGWSSISFFTGYCQPTGTGANSSISNVSMTGITNLNNTTGFSAGGYGNHTAVVPTISQAAGLNVNFTLTYTSDPGTAIWVDWNNNLAFEAGERMYFSNAFILGTTSGTFTVPALTPAGSYRMRVSADWNLSNVTNPCPLAINGETEDYTFVVAAPPTCGIPTGLATNLTSTTTVDISWVAPGLGTVVDYEYAVITSPTPPGSGTSAAGTSVVGVPVLANTNYYLHVRTNCTSPVSSSAWVTIGPFYTGYCVPVSTNDPATFGDNIANFTTTGGLTNINNSSGAGVPFGYQNFSGLSCSQIAGGTINFSVSTGGWSHNQRIWVDWNNNLVFEAGEVMYSSGAAAVTNTGSFNVPALQPVGNYRMRVRSVDGLNPIDPCLTYGYTEAEDYTFSVATPPTCYPVSGLNITALDPVNVSFSWTGPVSGNAPVQYYYAVTTSATPPVLGTNNGLSTSVGPVPHTPNTQNYIHVRTDCDGLGTDYSTWVTLPFFSGYCAATATDPISTYFTNFTTTGGVTNINNNSTNDPTGYQDFTAVSASEYPGEDFAVQFTMVGGTAGVNIWIDWNNDLDFNDAGEFAVGSGGFLAAGTYNSVVTVPITQPFGPVRLRMRTDWNTGNPAACGNINEGEAEDYVINIIPLPVCSTVLGSFATTYITSTDLPLVCTGQTVNFLSSPVAPQASGITYQLQYSAAIGGPYATLLGPQATNDFAVPAPATGYYRIQVLCSGTPLAGTTWTPVAVSISNPVITTTTPASRCGTGTLTLSATNSPALSTITWYTTASGGVAIATGPSFTTPSISTTTTYYVQAENVVPTATIGSGVTANTATAVTPFSSFYEGVRIMYVIRKSELQAAGLAASDLTSVAFNVSSTGAFGQNNFVMRMAHTTAVNANLGFATPNSGFTTVYNTPSSVPPPALGLRTFQLIPSAFAWNGVDNLIIEICHENDPLGVNGIAYGTNSGVSGTFLTFYSTYGRYHDNAPSCGLDVGTAVLSNFRPNIQIGGQIALCNSPRLPVVATVNAAPTVVPIADQNFAPSIGNFNPIPLTTTGTVGSTVTVTPAASIYLDAATTGLYTAGDNVNGVTSYWAPLTTTTYTVTATSPDGCTATDDFTVTVDQSGIPASACAATLVTAYNNMTWQEVNTLGSAGGLGAPCGGIVNEVWFKAVVSASGEMHVSTRANGVSLTDITESNVALYQETAPFGCANINQVACNTNGGAGSFSYASWYGLTPGETVYIRIAGLTAAAVPLGRLEASFANYLIWTPTNGDDMALAENWQQGDASAITLPSATKSILVPAGTIKPKMYANTTVRGVNLQGASPYYVSLGLDLNSFTLNVKGNWTVGPVASASTVLNCNGLVEFNGAGATPQTITGKTTFGNLNTNNAVGGVVCNAATGVSCVLTPVAGTLNGNGFLILKSPSANSAALVAPSAGTITGNVSVERKIGPTSGYHYLSAAVSGATVNNTTVGWRDDFTINAALDGQIFIPGGIYTSLATVWEYDETNANPNPDYGWIGATGAADNITPLKGFACVVPANVTVDVLGPLNNNIIPGGYTITRATDGLNAIGNPYPSPISWNAFRGLASNTLALSTSGYKAFITTGGYAGAYGTWNGTIGSPVSVTDRIASSQGILVECLQPAATINSLNTVRLTSAADVTATFFSGYNSVPDMIRMEVQGNGHANEMVVYFDASSVDAYNNNYDSRTVFAPTAGVPTIYSTVDNNNLAINVMGKLNMNKVVPVGVKIQSAGTYNLVATDMTSFAPSVIAYLEDTQTGTMTNLRTNPSYSVTLPEGEINNRFFLHFHPAVELNAVNETCAGNDGKLIINYPTTNTVNVVIKDANGNVVNSQNNVTGVVTINNLVAGNYVAEMTFGVAPNTYTTSDYFTVAGGNAVYANLSASANSVDMNANTTVNFTATAQGATSFNWNFGDGTVITNGPANVSHTFAQAGTYTVTFEASNGICNTISTTTVEVTNATGLTTIANSNLQVVGVGSKVTVRFGNKMEGTGNIEVINMLGEVVAHLDNVSMKGTREIEMSSIAAGQYLVKITNNNKLYTEKVYLSRQ